MKQGFRQSMAWLHTWAGLVPGWILYIVFLFGTAAFFHHEIDAWMRPELPAGTAVSSRALDAADTLLRRRGAGAESWTVSLPNARGGSGLNVSWSVPGQDRHDRQEITLDPQTGRELAVRGTQGGFFLYRMHFDLHYISVRWGRYTVCAAALAMLVAILSGVVTHKKIFTDFFQMRLGKGQRSWLDAHNATGVLALPFHIMITYTGLVTLLFTLMPWAITANFVDQKAFSQASSPRPEERAASGIPAPTMPLTRIMAAAERKWQGVRPGYIIIEHPGDTHAAARLIPERSDWSGGRRDSLYLDAAQGRVIPLPAQDKGGGSLTREVMVDLHTGWFAGIGVRWLYFLSGIGGTAMCATGLALWCVKRRTKLPDPARPHFGFRLVERLNIGFIAGAPGGVAAYFLANRLLPFTLAERDQWEIDSLFIVWGLIFAWTLARPAKRAWVEALAASAVLFALVPIVNAVTTSRGLGPSLLRGDWVFATFDLTLAALAASLAWTAWKVLRHQPKAPPARRRRNTVEAAA
ncbi:PepSY-associated TM helix domain-containing protein [Novosphingobium resinovorum]|uniref:PepSY-associated TM helix domain-containing protein n=1 Tax=Novosphingobium resinovorum TaxID=158500 RepID=UPI002ED25B5F|nr:PepSY-associated TM helix domain-containing protein [Novosphingobium resinovorum]